MDRDTLNSLQVALRASPDNGQLLLVVLEAHRELGDPAASVHWLSTDRPRLTTAQTRAAAGRLYLDAQAYDSALEVLTGDSAEEQLLIARCLHHLDRPDEARAAYDRAVTSNPTCEDPELRALLGARTPEVVRSIAGAPKLRVVSNDDTDDEDADRLIEPEHTPVKFEDVGGLSETKKQIHRRIILPFQKPSLFKRFRKRAGGGILLYGPPGCGKTLLARATAGECQARFFAVSITDILDMYIGESERKLHAIFDKARAEAPAVLFFDELEGLAGKRQFSREGTSAKLVSQFLSEMDGFSQDNGGVLVIGATNVPWAVDPAFRRPGRFDRMMFIPPPDRDARAAILDIHLAERPATDINSAAIAKGCPGFSGADLEHLVESAADVAIEASLQEGEEVPINMRHFELALQEVKPTTLEWLTTARNYARYANEGGHYDAVLDFLKRHGK